MDRQSTAGAESEHVVVTVETEDEVLVEFQVVGSVQVAKEIGEAVVMYAEIVMTILEVAAVEAEWMVGVGIDDEVVIEVVAVGDADAEVGAGTGLGLGVEIEDETEVGLGVDIEDETEVVTDAGVGAEPKELHNC